jgi:hypothetical protein
MTKVLISSYSPTSTTAPFVGDVESNFIQMSAVFTPSRIRNSVSFLPKSAEIGNI